MNKFPKSIFSKLPFILLSLLAITMAVFTALESSVNFSLYSHPMFFIAWTLFAVSFVAEVILRKKSMQLSLLLMHLSFIIMLIGALFTKFSWQGTMHLREGETISSAFSQDKDISLPFSLKLNQFYIEYYYASDTPKDFISEIEIIHGDKRLNKKISMNNVADIDGYRLFQTSYDEDLKGTILTISYDPYGVAITYFGYFLLAVSMSLFFFGKESRFRSLLRNPLWKTFTLLLFLSSVPTNISSAPRQLSDEATEAFGKIHILYNGRITQLETYALDFSRKVSGKSSVNGMDGVEILASWVFNPQEMKGEKFVKTESGLQTLPTAIEYLKKAKRGKKFDELDERIGLIISLYKGEQLRLFPITDTSETCRSFFPTLYRCYLNKDDTTFASVCNNMTLYQEAQMGDAFSPSTDKAEHIYNRYCNVASLAYASLTLGIISFVLLICGGLTKRKTWLYVPAVFLCVLVSVVIGLRTYISGRFPMSNGYETMLFIAWLSFVFTTVFGKRLTLLLPVGLLVGGFALLVSSINAMNPEITQLMPVLASPWMSLHVSLMMLSYTLFAFMAINSIVSLVLNKMGRTDEVARYVLLNRFLLYPSTFMLTIGMFIGAVWANESWGSYWSWDPKETWALITMIVYSLAFHTNHIAFLRRDIPFQIYLLAAFASILMTYFGVNYLLGGMHSYAG